MWISSLKTMTAQASANPIIYEEYIEKRKQEKEEQERSTRITIKRKLLEKPSKKKKGLTTKDDPKSHFGPIVWNKNLRDNSLGPKAGATLSQDNEMIIVNEYGANGSMDGYLEDINKRRNLTWVHQLKIWHQCMTRNSTKELFTAFKDPEREFRSSRKHFKTLKLRDNTFSGSDHEDANEHIEKVLEIMDLFHIPNITIDQVMLRAFPMSLTGAASRWLRNKPSGSITTWEDLKTKFLSKYCPPARTAKKMEEINNFQQEPDENLYQAWERFKELLMKCLQNYLTEIQEIVLFYNGLDVPTRQILDSRGAITSKTTADAKVAI
ncbi:retrovirus-related pol polyprotein from transposon TNT 1-94 [Tanacetum coccineum]|uniref:Retrovirus-related pol polyprotein from transposon TNT 1-94 n=1 Tax=Tanacetum coccineum TaxID=301880 RepID=A0ABQ5FH62_9ASTR